MVWTNGPLVLYHGTTEQFAESIRLNGIKLSYCASATEFGKGFYTTTSLPQARRHANVVRREQIGRFRFRGGDDPGDAALLEFKVDRIELAKLESLWFTSPVADWMDFVNHCLTGGSHMPHNNSFYDVVAGPIRNAKWIVEARPLDQVSFHTQAAVDALGRPDYTFGTPAF